jgi:hypothetical protein
VGIALNQRYQRPGAPSAAVSELGHQPAAPDVVHNDHYDGSELDVQPALAQPGRPRREQRSPTTARGEAGQRHERVPVPLQDAEPGAARRVGVVDERSWQAEQPRKPGNDDDRMQRVDPQAERSCASGRPRCRLPF